MVERRIGGLETRVAAVLRRYAVERRIGGLEIQQRTEQTSLVVERRIGGLESLSTVLSLCQ